MTRWQKDRQHMMRQCRLNHRFVRDGWVGELGRYRKRHALDCGTPHCHVCHANKYPKREKHEQEILADLSFREQLLEAS